MHPEPRWPGTADPQLRAAPAEEMQRTRDPRPYPHAPRQIHRWRIPLQRLQRRRDQVGLEV